jgi:hypothetical protein
MVNVFDFGNISEGSGDMLLVKLALFFITLILVNYVLRKNSGFDNVSNAIISIAVAILSVAFIKTDMLTNFFLTGYGLFGIITIAFLPFFLFFFFIQSFDFPLVRKVGLVTIGVFYFFIGYAEEGIFSLGSYWTQDVAWIYYGVAVLAFLVIIFEKPIRKLLKM